MRHTAKMVSILSAFLIMLALVTGPALAQTDPLPSWKEGQAKGAISDYERFQWVREQLGKEGIRLPLPTGN